MSYTTKGKNTISKKIHKKENFSIIISPQKFIFLVIITLGIYERFWMYKNWKFLKEKYDLKISPFWRAVFAIFFVGSLARHTEGLLKEEKIECHYVSTEIGSIYFIIAILNRLPGPYSLLSSFTFIPMIPLVKSMNNYWKKNEKKIYKKIFTLDDFLFILFMIVLILISILPEM